jgi:hypothetical protein
MHPTDLQELAHARQAAILEEAERRRALRRAGSAGRRGLEPAGRARAGPAVPRLAMLLQAPRRALALLLRRSRAPAGPRQQPA